MKNLISKEISTILNETTLLINKLKSTRVFIYPCDQYTSRLILKLQKELGIIIYKEYMLSKYEDIIVRKSIIPQCDEFFIILSNQNRDDWIVDLWNFEGQGIPTPQIITPDQLSWIFSSLNNKNLIDSSFEIRQPDDHDTAIEKHYKNEINFILKNLERCQMAYNILQDDFSKRVFTRILANRILRCGLYDSIFCKGQYFFESLNSKEKEVYMDIGAFSGDTVMAFVDKFPQYKKIYAFEPDKAAFLELIKNTSQVQNISLINAGLYNNNCLMPFKSAKFGSSHINGIFDWDNPDDTCEKQVFIKGDDLNLIPSFIKMDIEGSELMALNGLRKTISKYRPTLAICAYHQPDDLWEIPLMIHSINDSYKIILRHHSYETTETVCYAM